MPKRATNIGNLVDRLGAVKAQIADLELEEKSLREQIIKAGKEDVDGDLFHAHVTQFPVTYVAWKAVVESLPPSAQLTRLINRNSTARTDTRVTVTAR